MKLGKARSNLSTGEKSGWSADSSRWSSNVSLLTGIILLAIILRLPNLTESLWYDEVLYSTRWGIGSLKELLQLWLHDTPAPFYRLFMLPWLGIFTENELTVRIPSLIFSLVVIVLTYLIALEIKDKKTAVLSALFLTLSPVHVWYSQEATPYGMLLFFNMTAVLAFYRTTASNDLFWFSVYCVCIFLASFTHFFAVAFLLSFSVLTFMGKGQQKKRILVANLVVLLCLALFIMLKKQYGTLTTGMGFLRPFDPLEVWMLFFNWFLTGNSIWPVSPYNMKLDTLIGKPFLLTLQIAAFLIFLRGLFALGKEPGNGHRLDAALLLFCLPAALLILNLLGFRHVYIERYLMIAMPFFVIILASGTLNMKKKTVATVFPAALLALGLVSYMGLLSKNDQWTVYKQNPDWRSAAQHLSGEIKQRDKGVLVAATPALALQYYLQREWGKRPGEQHPRILPGWKVLREGFRGLPPRTDLYLIKNQYWKGNFNSLLNGAKQSSRLRFHSVASYKGVEIYRFRVLRHRD